MNRFHCLKVLTAALPLLALMGCATVQVQRVATDGREAAYELQGTNMPTLEIEARRLCPHGYEVHRQWQVYERLDKDRVYYVRLWERISENFSTPTNAKAQLAITCNPAPP